MTRPIQILDKGRLAVRLFVIVPVIFLALGNGPTISAANSEATEAVYYNEAAFLLASGATQKVSFPSGRALTTSPYSENGIAISQAANFNNTIGNFTPLLSGNEFVVSDRENLTIVLTSPVQAIGMRLQDGVQSGCIDNAFFPDNTYPNCTTTGGIDSSFIITLTNGGAFVTSLVFDPPADTASFFGIIPGSAFDRADIREIGGGVENDFFGAIFTSTTIDPPKGLYSVYLPLVSRWPSHPLYIGLVARWDGVGFIRTNVFQNVGYHLQRYLDAMTDADIIRVENLEWYDPNPNGWATSTWYDYYSVSTGEYRASSGPSDPAWKWGAGWLLPYGIQLHNGQTILVGGQAFLVSGPLNGYTTGGKAIQYWQFVNRDAFVFWDAGGDWKQVVNPGDITLRYHTGWSRLLLYEDVLRRYYYQDAQTSYTVQYITDLTYSTSIPETLPVSGASIVETTAEHQSLPIEQNSPPNGNTAIYH